MKNKRRDFIKLTGMAGIGLAGSGLMSESFPEPDYLFPKGIEKKWQKQEKANPQRFNMSGYAAPPIDKVRIGIIGMGQRGPSHMVTMRHIENVEIKALCDISADKLNAAKKLLAGTKHDPVLYSGNEEEWKKLCERDDIDLVIVTTPWYMHAAMAVYAMNHGKHVVTEVTSAATIEECWQLVEAAERTKQHCMMLENYAYGSFQLLTLNMARKGFFGEIVHGDCAYNTSKMKNNFSKKMYWNMWWLKQYGTRRGNIYPAHGVGAICQLMNINRGDKLKFLVCVDSDDFMMKEKAKELSKTDDFFKPFAEMTYRGNMSVTTIRTENGKTIMLQHDGTSPRGPHTCINSITGTNALAQEYPLPPRISIGLDDWLKPEEYQKLADQYTPVITKRVGELARLIGAGHGGTDLFEDWHLIDCLRNGLPLDQDVYDAASWSAIVPLSEWSVRNNSNSIEFPDFTRGSWETNKLNMDINLEMGGGNTKVIV
jgi:hypothetical protein